MDHGIADSLAFVELRAAAREETLQRARALAAWVQEKVAERANRETQRSPRSASPRRRRDYDRDRSRSPSREPDRYRSSRRERSPVNGTYDSRAYSSYSRNRAPPSRTHEEREVSNQQMMSNVRETSQQDRRVYVGNLAYEVKWHHLKDFMRAGEPLKAF